MTPAAPWLQMIYELRTPEAQRIGWEDNAALMAAAADEIERLAKLASEIAETQDAHMGRLAAEVGDLAVGWTRVERAIRYLRRLALAYGDMQDGNGNAPTEVRHATGEPR